MLKVNAISVVGVGGHFNFCLVVGPFIPGPYSDDFGIIALYNTVPGKDRVYQHHRYYLYYSGTPRRSVLPRAAYWGELLPS